MRPIIYILLISSLALGCNKKVLDRFAGTDGLMAAVAPIPGYAHTWADEFDSLSLDTIRWKYRIGVSQESYQRPENVSLDSGKLVISLKCEEYMGQNLTGGGIITNIPNGYGYYEVRAKMDGGYGWHEAFWTTGSSGFGDPNPLTDEGGRRLEIDCFEHYGDYDAFKFTYGAIEWGPYQGSVNRDYVTTTQDLAADYHTYGFEYTPDYLNYYFEGELLKTIDMRDVPQHDFYAWLTCIATKPDATNSGTMYFDYIRAYEISSAEYEIRKVPFINYLDSIRGPQHSNGTDLWIEAEDFIHTNNWNIERDLDNALVVKGFTSFDSGRDSAALTARTGIVINSAGNYRLWVRSRDFNTAPGTRQFKVLVNGVESATTFGTHGTHGYDWQAGGVFYLNEGVNILDVFDSSQYHARCDKILLTTDTAFTPERIGGVSNVVHDDNFLGLQPFGEGNLVVVRIGNGAGQLVLGAAHPVFLEEYTNEGTLVRSIPMPVSVSGASKRLTLSVSATDQTEGYLSRSANGKYLALAGYDAAPGYSNVVATAGNVVNRVVALVGDRGQVNTTTALPAFGNVAVRSAVTDDGSKIWVTGGGNGIRYVATGNTASHTLVSSTGRCLTIFGNQLYASSTATGFRVATVGTGLPTTSGQVMANLPGIPNDQGSPYGIFLADLSDMVLGVDVLYVADEWSGALSKYSLVGGSWTLNGQVGTSADQYRGLAGRVGTGAVELFATRKNAGSVNGGGELVKIVDGGGYNTTLSATPVVIASAPPFTLFRGVALAPTE
ncbi:glycoside hydrolase family 16 protein [Parapedobacter tibetensis]|uniref:glycoside hydrolase family 16 protein n=1 Tax=Parapedobacter tibetensis TaxID=2972951 RepID=UPI00214D80BF|nr:glycoside hydrolase family 16 protein [Parapedobacter tibetensis]